MNKLVSKCSYASNTSPLPLPSLGVQLHHISSAEATGAAGSRIQGEGRGEGGEGGEGGGGHGGDDISLLFIMFPNSLLSPCHLVSMYMFSVLHVGR